MKNKPLDNKDLKIVDALFKYGYKSSANFLSTKISIPTRTIAHRIKKLKTKGYIRLYPGVKVRKLGLNACHVLLQEKKEAKYIANILVDIPYSYLISSIYGKFTGVGVYFVYDSESYPSLLRYLDLLVKKDIIEKYYLLQINKGGYMTTVNISNYDLRTLQWDWDIDLWSSKFKKGLTQIKEKPKRDIELSEKIIKFDTKDIKILKELLNILHSDIETVSYSQHISKEINLSATQVTRRMNRLEREDVLIFLINFQRAHSEITTFVLLFIELKNKTKFPIIECFLDSLPFQFDISLESPTKMCIFTYCNSRDFKWLLRAIDEIKPYTREVFIEIIPFYYNARHHKYICWNEEKKEWKTDYEQYINDLEENI